MKTPKTEKQQSEADKEKLSGKKLVQARLPFKILTTPPARELSSSKEDLNEARKRKLSYDKDESDLEQAAKKRILQIGIKHGNIGKKIQEDVSSNKIADVVVLSESDSESGDTCSKENVKTNKTSITTVKLKLFASEEKNDLPSDDIELDSSDEESKQKDSSEADGVKSVPVSAKLGDSKKSTKAETPKSGKKTTLKERKSTGETTFEPKVLIKLPLSAKKNKRRKTTTQETIEIIELPNSDDEKLAIPDQLQKRPKPEDNIVNEEKKFQLVKHMKTDEVVSKTQQSTYDANKEEEKHKVLNKEKSNEKEEDEKTENDTEAKEDIKSKNEATCATYKVQVDLEKVSPLKLTKVVTNESKEDVTSESDTNQSKIQEQSNTSTDVEADAETETTTRAKKNHLDTIMTASESAPTTPKLANDTTSNMLQKKNLTPKQQKLLEQRLKAREEKERKIQEERLQKQREKEERELARKREREEKEEQKRKEREEKEDQRRKEREEKERKRLAEIEAKNEEKRKRNEAKEDELRKKEEERKRKDQEKEEAELKKKKAAMAFTKFFSRSASKTSGDQIKVQDVPKDSNVVLAFRPFQIKGAMRLAPIVRKNLTDEALSTLETILKTSKETAKQELYLQQLKTGLITPQKWILPIQKESDEAKQETDSGDDDVILVEDELERAGQAIFEEPVAPVERLRVKFYSFAENRRPPYYGTWRKKSKVITPRRPFMQDKQFFDYDVDSDDEWEEEEPGESLNGSDDDKEKESEDEDYEVDNEWFVPHGHLSDEEMQGEDDLGENNDREAQKAKLQILQKEFAQEMKKKTEKIKPRLIGCIWVDENGNQPELCPNIIWNTLNTRAILCGEPPLLEEIETKTDKDNEANTLNGQTNKKSASETTLKPIQLSETMLKQLVKLVHGNTHSRNFIIKEFIAYVEANEESVRNGDVRGPLKSAVREKIAQFAQWQVLELSGDDKNNQNSNAKKKKNKKKLCWVVSAETLKNMNIENIELKNNWQYILKPNKPNEKPKTDTNLSTIANAEDSNEHIEANVEQTGSPTSDVKAKADEKKLKEVLTAVDEAQQFQKPIEMKNTSSTEQTVTATSSAAMSTTNVNTTTKASSDSTTPIVKKRVPLLMSVARGEAISTPDKNKKISQYLKTLNDAKQREKEKTTPMEIDEVITLD